MLRDGTQDIKLYKMQRTLENVIERVFFWWIKVFYYKIPKLDT